MERAELEAKLSALIILWPTDLSYAEIYSIIY